MKAAVLIEPRRFVIEERPVPVIGGDQILVRVLACGICMSEYHNWNEGNKKGDILGHEPVGLVADLGAHVRDFKQGDRVTGCIPNSFAEYTAVDAALAVKLPDAVSDLEGILEPWSCLISAAGRVPVGPGSSVALVGCGYMGLGFLQLIKLRGAEKIIAVDIRGESLENALRFGADEVYTPDRLPPEYLLDTWEGDIFKKGIDVVVEITGEEAALALAGRMVRPHGTLAIMGFHQSGGPRNIDMQLWNWKGIDVINVHERRAAVQRECFAAAITLIQEKKLRVKDMMTNGYSLEDINRAFLGLREKPRGYIKGYINIDGRTLWQST